MRKVLNGSGTGTTISSTEKVLKKFVTVQPASHSPAAKRLCAAYAALDVIYGRAPNVK